MERRERQEEQARERAAYDAFRLIGELQQAITQSKPTGALMTPSHGWMVLERAGQHIINQAMQEALRCQIN